MDVRTGNIYEGPVKDGREEKTEEGFFKLSGDNCTDYCRLASKFCCICIKKEFRAKCRRFEPKRGFKLVKRGEG